jgi:hypothetical protein
MELKLLIPFVIVWVILCVWGTLFFTLNTDAKLKRKLYPWVMVSMGILFILSMYWINGKDITFLISGFPIVLVVSFISIKYTKFCNSCGRTMYSFPLKSEYCSKCGNKLD